MGNTANIASRLESVSQPGSLSISEEVFEGLSDRLKLNFKKLGRLVLKNITQGVVGYSSQPILDMDHLGFEVLGRQTQQQIKYCNSADGTTIALGKTGTGLPFLKAPNFVTHLDYDWGSEIWQPIYEEISQLGMLVRFDQRGNGLSERNPNNISFSSMVEDISAVVENEKLEKEVLDIHDEVMPWLDDMKAMRRTLSKTPFENKNDSMKAVQASIALHRADSLPSKLLERSFAHPGQLGDWKGREERRGARRRDVVRPVGLGLLRGEPGDEPVGSNAD